MLSNKNLKRIITFFLPIGFIFLAVSLQCFADEDVFSTYLANLYLLESHQVGIPNSIFHYSDLDNGALLKSVLDPNQAKQAISIFIDKKKLKQDTPDLPRLIEPIIVRYDKAFTANPSLYESEYLDSIETSSLLLNSYKDIIAMSSEPKTTINDSPNAGNNQAFLENIKKMTQSMSSIMTNINSYYADSIRKKIASNMFTPDGALRASKIANSISLPNCSEPIIDEWQKQVLSYVNTNKQYPKIAQMRGWQGNGVATLTLQSNMVDNKSSCEISVSTGYEVLDHMMLQTCTRPDFPTLKCHLLQGKTIQAVIPLSFKLEMSNVSEGIK